MDLSKTAERIKKRRNELHLKGYELAEKALVSDKSTISNWENGAIPKLENIISLSKALECEPEYLLGCVEHPDVTTSWIAEQIPLSEEAINYLRWLKVACDDGTMEEHELQRGMIDTIICSLYRGINDGTNNVIWDASELMTLLVMANRDDEENPLVNHTVFIRQAFCMALGGVAFDYISNIANKNMAKRRAELEESEKFIREFDERIKSMRKRREELGISDKDYAEMIKYFTEKGCSVEDAIAFIHGKKEDEEEGEYNGNV